MYSEKDIRAELIQKHGSKLDFLFNEFGKRGFEFKVQKLFLRRFDGTKKGAYVDAGASTLALAGEWALDAFREWAGEGRGTYFAEISRQWAINGEGKGDAAASLGTTIDWLYLFSVAATPRPSREMYPVFHRGLGTQDFFDIYCWIFSNKITPLSRMPPVDAKVNLPSTKLNSKYWDSKEGVTADQTHHFAAYFWWGANIGTSWYLLKQSLAHTDDYDTKKDIATNPGDVNLGKLAADWGSQMRSKPGYIGREVEASLR